LDEVKTAVRLAIRDRGWSVNAEGPGFVEALWCAAPCDDEDKSIAVRVTHGTETWAIELEHTTRTKERSQSWSGDPEPAAPAVERRIRLLSEMIAQYVTRTTDRYRRQTGVAARAEVLVGSLQIPRRIILRSATPTRSRELDTELRDRQSILGGAAHGGVQLFVSPRFRATLNLSYTYARGGPESVNARELTDDTLELSPDFHALAISPGIILANGWLGARFWLGGAWSNASASSSWDETHATATGAVDAGIAVALRAPISETLSISAGPAVHVLATEGPPFLGLGAVPLFSLGVEFDEPLTAKRELR
jgi:hypothetical protein